jgi:hypothetical protein
MIVPLRIERAESEVGRLDDEIAALIKGMLKRGDKQSDIAACFLINSGRVAEINTGQRFADVKPQRDDLLPPAGPYPSPHELWNTKQELWRVRLALEAAANAIQQALVFVHKAEQR